MKTFRKLVVSIVVALVFFTTITGAYADEIESIQSAVVINRTYSTYSQTSPIGQKLRYGMNCYGYALQVYALNASSSNSHKQQPGEFVQDQESFLGLYYRIDDILNSSNITTALNGIEDLVEADFAQLYNSSDINAEWKIQPTTASASVPSGYRKIALAIGLGDDYHFYMRHNDGTWSHKQGFANPTNKSIDTNVALTDNNISTKALEGDYDDGVRFYLIKKSAIADYPHDICSLSSNYTTTAFQERAGDTITKARTIYSANFKSRFDYTDDNDYFAYTPTTSGNYTFTTSLTSSTYDVQMIVYDSNGSVLAIDASTGNPSINVHLTANKRYFIRVYDDNDNICIYYLIRN